MNNDTGNTQLKQAMGFEEYERDWKRKHKASIPRKARVSSLREYFWIGFWLLVAAGAAIFSAAHTIPAAEMTIFQSVPNRSQLAITVFVIVELVIFGAAAGRREIKWLVWLLVGAILVALAGNISSSVRAVTENGGDWLNQFGGILLAIIAPITALAAGEVLHIQLDKLEVKRQAAQAKYDAECKEMDAKILQGHNKQLKDIERENSRNYMKSDEPLAVHVVSRTPSQPRVKLHEVARLVRENGDEKLSVNELMEKYHISQGSTTKIREILGNGHSKNGHSEV